MAHSNRASDDPDEDSTKTFVLADLLGQLEESVKTRSPVLVKLIGSGQGKVYRLAEGQTDIGRDCDGIRLDDEGVSRLHARVFREGHTIRVVDLLGSTNGTLCNAHRLQKDDPVELREGDRLQLGPGVVLRFETHDDLESTLHARLYALATRDALTGLHNRRAFHERMQSEWVWHKRHREPCTLVALDLDHFKRINDTWGHAAGDAVLRDFAKVVLMDLRAEDVSARTGGEEFVVLLRRTAKPEGTIVAERLRSLVERHAFTWKEERLPVTVSCGVATSDEVSSYEWKDLLGLADQRLYAAKQLGRNQVQS